MRGGHFSFTDSFRTYGGIDGNPVQDVEQLRSPGFRTGFAFGDVPDPEVVNDLGFIRHPYGGAVYSQKIESLPGPMVEMFVVAVGYCVHEFDEGLVFQFFTSFGK